MSQKNITRFANQTEYDTAFDNGDMSFPNVSYIDKTDDVIYSEENPYLITGRHQYNTRFDFYTMDDVRHEARTVEKEDGRFILNVKPYVPFKAFNKASTVQGTGLFEINFPSGFDTSNMTSMAKQFYREENLVSIDISNWNTSNVTKMNSMFEGCSNLTSLDVSNFNTENVANMSYMFRDCSAITSLDISNWNTSNVTDMNFLFYNCSTLTSLDLSNFNTSNVTSMSVMFYNCSNLTILKMCGIGDGTKNVTTSNMFDKCAKLANIESCGAIHNTVDFASCPLTLDSAKVVLNALSTPYLGAQKLTFNTTTKSKIKANAEAMAIVTEKRAMGWTISL